MLERNLGNAERIARLLTGLLLLGWAVQQPSMNGIDWFVVLVSVALVLNGIFSRCYLWYLLDIDSSRRRRQDSSTPSTCP